MNEKSRNYRNELYELKERQESLDCKIYEMRERSKKIERLLDESKKVFFNIFSFRHLNHLSSSSNNTTTLPTTS